MRFLLDSNVISEIGKGALSDRNVTTWFAAIEPQDLCTSVLVIGEMRAGVEKLRLRGADRTSIFERGLVLVVDLFADRIIGIDRRVAEQWGRLAATRRLPAIDGLIAATALVHEMVVVTRNVRDFERTGAKLLNPFEPREQ